MGTSFTLFKYSPLELSIEVDRDLCIEISTGFGPNERATTSSTIPLTVESLGGIVAQLQEIYELLKVAKTCQHCGCYFAAEKNDCDNGCEGAH